MTDDLFYYKGQAYPNLIKNGNHQQYIRPIAEQVCKGVGIDIGSNRKEWALPGVKDMVDIEFDAPWNDAFKIPVDDATYDFVFSSHCLEHLGDYYSALEEWTRILKPGGVMLLYLPHRNMEYWWPQNNRKHRRICHAEEIKSDLFRLGFEHTLASGCDLAYSFSVLGYK